MSYEKGEIIKVIILILICIPTIAILIAQEIINNIKYKKYEEELNLYEKLQNYSNPAAYIKDVLRGLLPIPCNIKISSQIENGIENEVIEDDEDLMDI